MATIIGNIPGIEEIEAAVAKLTPGQRGVLIDRIREMDKVVDPGVEAAWDTEIRRRIKEIENGEVECIDGEQVMREMREKFGFS